MNKTVYVGIIVAIIVAASAYYFAKGRDWDDDDSYEYQSAEQTTEQTAGESSGTSAGKESTNGTTGTTGTASENSSAGTGTKTFTMAEIATHNGKASCYSVVRNNVYDLTKWIGGHPGGEKAILGICGKDGTKAFEGQHGGKGGPEKALESMKIGVLAQ